MSDIGTANIVLDGEEQIVLLPEGLELPGTEVAITRVGRNILIVPLSRQSPGSTASPVQEGPQDRS